MEMDFVPNFIYKSQSGEISNIKSSILSQNDISFISYNNSINIWDFRSSTLLKSITNKKHSVSCFNISEKYLFVGFWNGLIKIYKNDFEYEKILKYRNHTKRIISIKEENNFIISASSDGLVYKYDLELEKSSKIFQTSPIDVFDTKNDLVVVGTGDCTFTMLKDEKEHSIILDNRLKFLSILDDNNFLFVFRDNNIQIYDLKQDKFKECKKFKKIKSVKRVADLLYILSDKKFYIFEIKNTKNGYILVDQNSLDCKSNVIDFSKINQEFFFITKDNSYIKNKLEIGYHKENIINLEKDENERICSFSKDKLIIWNVTEDKFVFYNQILVSEGKSLCIFNECYVIAERDRILFVNINDLKIKKIIEIEENGNNNIFISKSQNSENFLNNKKEELCDDFLAIAINSKVDFLDKNFDVFDTLELEDYVSCLKIFNEFIFIGLLNSKVYIYDKNKDLYKTLYGHALPVINIDVTDKLIYTIGADKMLKIWGLDFGDCRKSIIVNNSANIQVINDEMFIFGGSTLKYFKGFKIYHEKKYFDCTRVLLDKNFLVGANDNILRYFHVDKYELEKLDEDSEDSAMLETNSVSITNTSKYEEFLDLLEETNLSNFKINEKFNRLVQEIGLGVLNSFIVLLNSTQIFSLIDLLEYCENTIVASRIFNTVAEIHKDQIIGNKKCNEIRKILLEKMKSIRDKLGKNTYKMILRTGMQFPEF
ncbi:U3 small nucleolar RNA-associated protein 12 (UTP12) [Vairimorpha necatrix]|uniref:U3 small nucleolar RNA-associated protein 12 (UTP12) n=1 Tax=Vairimorpha necatrix TaxID=6039 RepID=A0AAX4JAC7_9MICR